MVKTFRFAALALLALSSTISGQLLEDASDTDESVLISNGVADCIDAMIYINDDSIDTTTIGTGATRTIAGVVTPSVPSTETETDFNIYYSATITRETTSAVTTLVIADICTFKLDCTSLQNYNFSCTYDIMLATPSFEFSDYYYATATDNDDLATTWGTSIIFLANLDGEGTPGSTTTPTSGYPSSGSTPGWPSVTPTGTANPNSRGPTPASSSPPPTTWPYPTVTTHCPTCPTTTVTLTSTIPCPVCPGGKTVTLLEQCLTLQPNWYEIVPVTTRTITEECDCKEKGGTTVYIVTEPCGPIPTTTTEFPDTTEEDCDCEETSTECDIATLPTTTCTTTPVVKPTPVTPVLTPVVQPTPVVTPSVVVFKSGVGRVGVSLSAVILGLVLCFVF